MTERRYSEKEIAAIFERAAEAQQTGGDVPRGEGMTLAELQEIGREVGIPPGLVAQAAQSIDRRKPAASRRFLGLPVGVGRTVDLGRRISEDEWQQLVVHLRETFNARGTVRSDGVFRQWTNGNLQALLEPTPTGHRLRMQTVKGDALGFMSGGLAMAGAAAAVVITSLVTGGVAESARVIVLLSTMGLGIFGVGALRLPGWARLRRRQMEEVAQRLQAGTHPAP